MLQNLVCGVMLQRSNDNYEVHVFESLDSVSTKPPASTSLRDTIGFHPVRSEVSRTVRFYPNSMAANGVYGTSSDR